MSETPVGHERSPEPSFSELCVKLEDKFSNLQDLSKAEPMRVYARIRPMLDSEIKAGYKECVGVVDDHVVRAVFPASSAKYKASSHLSQDIIEDFTFTAAYGPEAGQFVFFELCMMDTMQNFIEGQNSLVFSYGTTGSGKTFTLQGNSDNPGIIPLSLHLFFASIENQLFDKIIVKPDKFADVIALNDNEAKKELEMKEKLLSACDQEDSNFSNSSTKSFAMMLCDDFSEKLKSDGRQTTLCPEEMAQAQAASLMREVSRKSAEEQTGCCSVWVSFVEIYNENIYDLLQPNINQRTKLSLGEDKNGDVYVKGLREICVNSSYEALKLLNFGQRNLKIASTKLNYQSSRSHCIFTVKVIRIPDSACMTHAKVNRLSFCDLAGSERAAKSQTTGIRLKEAGCINTSLLVLGRCLEQLRLKASLRDKKLIPFRESKVTRLFSGFFTGRGKAVMITNASPSELTFDETLHALRFSAIAKELIINDSYIATASSTLQSITNMWTNARNNCKDNSSDKSISFEDSMDEVIQEKDELIEKLLDLAESLRNNLEREKKERAELEMKIRQDVCNEYSSYSDELLASQKVAFEEEREAIKEIYQKRISAMEQMYENIIKDYNIQLEENDSSTDEICDDFEIKQSQNICRQLDNVSNGIKSEITEFEARSSNLVDPPEELERTKEEYQKTVEYSLSLEAELESYKKKLEDAELELRNTIKINDDLKKELDAFKIDCVAYKTDNDNLLKEKLAIEDDVKLLTEDLASVSQDRVAISEKLAKSECSLASQSEEIKNLLQNINELIHIQEESTIKYKKSLEEANSEVCKVKNELLATSQKLTEERNNRCNLQSVVTSLEMKISELEGVNQKEHRSFEALTKELDDVREENTKLKERLEAADLSVAGYCQETLDLKDEIEKLHQSHLEDIKQLNDSIKQHEGEAKEAEKILQSVNKTLDNALLLIEEQKKKLEDLETECTYNKNEVSLLKNVKEDLEKKLESALANFNAEKNKRRLSDNETKQIIEELTNKCANMKSECLKHKEEIDALHKINVTLEETISSLSKELDLQRSRPSPDNELEKASHTIKEQAADIEVLKCENLAHKDEICTLKETKLYLEDKLSAASVELESVKECARKELDDMKFKLEEALSMVDERRKEVETLLSETAKLKNLNKKLEGNLNLKNENLAKLEQHGKEFHEAELTIKQLKSEIENLKNKSSMDVQNLSDANATLQDKLNSQTAQCETLSDLVKVLERCEIEATNKAKEMLDEVGKLKMNHAAELTTFLHLIEVLEKCELVSSDKIKEFHTRAIKSVEQIMDLEKCNKIKEKAIADMTNDYNALQKQLRDVQTSSKKQLLVEKQQYTSVIDNMKKEMLTTQKEVVSLSQNIAKLENEISKLQKENGKIKDEKNVLRKEVEELERSMKELESVKNTLASENEKFKEKEKLEKNGGAYEKALKSEKRNTKSEPIKQEEKENDAQISIHTTKSARNIKRSSSGKREKENDAQITVHTTKSARNSKRSSSGERNQGEKRKNKVMVTKSNVSKNKKQKSKIYEETDENTNIENKEMEKRIPRRQLRCMENDLMQDSNRNLTKSKTLKRKETALDNESSEEKQALKKLKLHEPDGIENISKPQNLRVKLLKATVAVNDIPVPSPRMTRGRKRLVQAKENVAWNKPSPRSVRS